MAATGRQFYIDNLRILLTALVVMHHLAITYGGPGLWYYNEVNTSNFASIILAMFVATNQSFFMGMFFMISAYFLEKSTRRKSTGTIARDRLKRLGIPILFYVFVLSPIIVYLITRFDKGVVLSIGEFYKTADWLTFGPLWFLAALLIFTMIALLVIANQSKEHLNTTEHRLPNGLVILAFAIGIGLISFLLRLWFPVGWALKPFGFQLAHFGQYIILYFIGFFASRYKWFDKITYDQSIKWLRIVAIMVLVIFPVVFYFGGALTEGTEVFMGGWSIQSLVYCLWEQIVGIGIMVGLLGVFNEHLNFQKAAWKEWSASAYTVYIIHAIVLVSASLLIRNLAIPATVKFVLLAPASLFICFWLSGRIRKLPFAKDVL